MPSQRSAVVSTTTSPKIPRVCVSALVLFLLLLSAIPSFVPSVSPDPGYVDNGDYTKSVFWNFSDAGDYVLYNSSISGGTGQLTSVNETIVENTDAQYVKGTRTNLDNQTVLDSLAIADTSLNIQTLTLQPGAEGIDSYLDEWFPAWNPDGLDLDLSPEYDPDPVSSERCRIVMQFDLSGVPAGATIVDATLLLYEKSGKGGPIFCSIHALNHSFNEQTVSWRTGWMTNGGDFSTESFSNTTVDGTNGWHSFDLSRLVDLWTRGAAPNYGFIIVPRDETFDGTKTFATSDVTNKPEQRPQLVIRYMLGEATGTYRSSALGPGTNATFTLASWTDGFISKITDEFPPGSLASKWEWTNDPALAGGSVNFGRPGWLNITGSEPTDLANTSIGCNYLHQNVSGDFQAETSLQEYFTAGSMGAGLLMKNDDLAWLAIYKTGVQGAGQLVAQACRGGFSYVIGSVPWPTATAFLRIDRIGSTYQLLASTDGVVWSGVASYSPPYDFTQKVSIGLCVFSGRLLSNPVVEFDFMRVQPVGQSVSLEMRIRTGNSTNLADPSWQPWGAPVGPSTGTVIGIAGKYMQYEVNLTTQWEWLSPLFSGITCHAEHYLPNGTVTTFSVYPSDLAAWETMTVTHSTSGGIVRYYYSTDLGQNWQLLGSGSSFTLSVTEPSMMVRMELQTYDTLKTPSIDTIELLYSVSIAWIEITAPASVVAGTEFIVNITARDPSNNIATNWNGTVTLHAMDATGTADASDELYTTQVEVPKGGTFTLWNQRYDSAETIRISALVGTVRGISSQIAVQPGPAMTMTMDPGNTTMYDHTSEAFLATAEDAFGNIITGSPYTWTAEPSLGTLNTTNGRTVLLTVGEYYTGGYLNVTCSGLTISRWIDVIQKRFAPSIASLPDQSRTEDSGEWTVDLSSYVSDVEDPLSALKWYTTHESVVGVRGENRTGNLIVTFYTLPNVFGSSTINVVVVDSDGMKSTTTLNMTIEPVNDPPSIEPIDPIVVQGGVPYVYSFEPYVRDTDDSGTELTLSVDAPNEPYAMVQALFITFNYPESMLGTTQTVIITVTDPEGASATTALLVKILDNAIPQQTGMLPTIALDQGTTLEDCAYLPNYFRDPGDTLTFDWECSHSTIGIKLDGHINVTAPDTWYGVEYAIIRAIDSHGARVEGIMQIIVNQVDHPVTMNGVPDLKVRHDERYDFDLWPYVNDPDDSPEELVYTSSDAHCSIVGTVLSILYPLSMNNTINPVTITVIDGVYSASCTINITVSGDYPPDFYPGRPLPDHSFQEDNPTRYPMEHGLEYYFLDQEDGQVLTFVSISLNNNVTAIASKDDTGVWRVDLNTTQDYYGSSRILIRAIDSVGALVEQTIILEVTPVPDAPILALPDTFTVIEGQQMLLSLGDYIDDPDSFIHDGDFTFTVQIIGSLDDGEEYLACISTLPGTLLFQYPSGFLKDHDSSFTIEVVATDQTGKVGRDEIVIHVEKPSGRGTDPIMLIAAVLATVGGVSGMGAIAYARRKKPFVIRDMMLVHNDGFLIGRYANQEHVEGEIDQDILSGMLTAVLNFVEDSMSSTHESLKTFGFKHYQVLVQRGTKTFAAIVYEGDLPKEVEKPIGELLSTFERVYKKKILSWTGDIETDFAGVELLIQSFVKDHSKKSGKKSMNMWGSKKRQSSGPAK